MRQLTREEAVSLHDGNDWQRWTDHQKAAFQTVQNLLCIPFSEYHRCMEVALERSVWTHEFADRARLTDELLGKVPAPTMGEIVALLPADKVVILTAGGTHA